MHEAGRILILDILEILQEHTDQNNRITQKELINLLVDQYDYNENLYKKRKTVRRHLEHLLRHEAEHPLRKEPKVLYGPKKESGEDEARDTNKNKTMTNFGYAHTFQQKELRLLIDSLLFSPRIPNAERKQLIEKLESLASKHFESSLDLVRTTNKPQLLVQDLFKHIESLEKAMQDNKKVSFQYVNYTVDQRNKLQLTNRQNSRGEDRTYLINPYELVATDGKYYLICNNDPFDNVSHYRVDRMMNVEIVNERRKPMRKVRGLENGLDLSRHIAEHIYMFGGQSTTVSLRFKKYVLNEFIDWFGTNDLYFSNQTEDEVTVTVKVNETAMRKWALQYALHVTVTSPKSLVEDIKDDLRQAMARYDL